MKKMKVLVEITQLPNHGYEGLTEKHKGIQLIGYRYPGSTNIWLEENEIERHNLPVPIKILYGGFAFVIPGHMTTTILDKSI
ncbi:hypothetical protein [Enterovibrio norvegicus]|uniref:hypothetical protein n=1 Tax=Enterovibrio norvegicus TaxID=188144 RepID=UPI00352C6391